MQKSTIVLLIIAILFGAIVYYYEIELKSQQEQIKQESKQIFSFTEDQVEKIIIKRNSEILEFERLKTPTPNQKWQMKSPSDNLASDPAVAYLLDLLAKSKTQQNITTTNLKEYGLDQPQAIIDITLKNQKNYKLALGKLDFQRNFVYAQSNPHPENQNILIIPIDFKYAIDRPLSEWKHQPSSPTPSPTTVKP